MKKLLLVIPVVVGILIYRSIPKDDHYADGYKNGYDDGFIDGEEQAKRHAIENYLNEMYDSALS